MYYKIPLDADLSETSYRAFKDAEDCAYIDYNDGYINPSWEEVTEERLIEVFGYNPFVEESTPSTPEPSQLDRIETALNELAAGSVSTSAVDEAITEGVNDV